MRKIIALLIIVMILATGCTQENTDVMGAYMVAIDKLYNEDVALNSNIKYIAIDTSLINNLSDVQKSNLLKKLEKYGYTVLDMTFDELLEEGYIEDLTFNEGILFKIEDNPMSGKIISMNVSKWRSGLGAIGYNNLKVKFKSGSWTITDTGSAWIS